MTEAARNPGLDEGHRHPYRWEECTWPEIREMAERGAVVVVPTASTEQHGPHLPLCTDSLIVTAIADQAVAQARMSVPALLAPALTVGCSQHHMRFPGTLAVDDVTFIDMVTQVGLSITSHGFRQLLYLNGHAGNKAALEIAVSRIHRQTGALCAAANYWAFLRRVLGVERRSNLGGLGHACEFETAAVMALRPDLVRGERPSFIHGQGESYWSTDWYENSVVTVGFSVEDLSPSGVLGDPAAATAESGTRWLEVAAAEVARFIVAFHGWTLPGLRVEGGCSGR